MLEGQPDEIAATVKSPSSNFNCDSAIRYGVVTTSDDKEGLSDQAFPTQTSAPQLPSIVEDYRIQLSGIFRRCL
jgi:hypothetical protein